MSVALHLYQQLRDAPDDDSRAKAIASAFEQLEEHYPNLKDVATQDNLRETELRLQKEIKEVEGRLQKEIREVEAKLQRELREVEARLQLDIKDVELKIKEVEVRLQREIKDVEVRLTQAIHRQTYWVIGSVGTIIGFIRLLDWLLASLAK